MRKAYYIFVVVLVALAFPASASGLSYLQHYQNLAYQYWVGPPPCGTVTVEWAQAEMKDKDGKPLWGSAYIDACHIVLSPVLQGPDREFLCGVVMHEYGHLHLGKEHSDDPTHLMHRQGGHNAPEICNRPLPGTASAIRAYNRMKRKCQRIRNRYWDQWLDGRWAQRAKTRAKLRACKQKAARRKLAMRQAIQAVLNAG